MCEFLGSLSVDLSMSRREHHDGKMQGIMGKNLCPRALRPSKATYSSSVSGGTVTCTADDPPLGVDSVWWTS